MPPSKHTINQRLQQSFMGKKIDALKEIKQGNKQRQTTAIILHTLFIKVK